MIGLCIFMVTLSSISGTFSEDLLKLQFPLYGLTEIAAREYGKVNSPCNNQLKSLFYGIKKRERWALKMLGASGAPVSGFIWGNNYWLGSYSQCMWITNTKQVFQAPLQMPDDVQPFRVTFYLSLFKGNSSVKPDVSGADGGLIHLGLCLPSACKPSELETVLVEWTNSDPLASQNLYDFRLDFQHIRAIQRDFSWVFSPVFLGLGVAVAIVILLTLSGTLYDVYVWTPLNNKKLSRKNNNEVNTFINIRDSSKLLNRDNNLNECCELKINNSQFKSMPIHVYRLSTEFNEEKPKPNFFSRLSLCFSVKSNGKLFKTRRTIHEELAVVHGLRFFGMTWLIWLYLAHYVKSYAGNKRLLYPILKAYFNDMVASSTFAYDTFFFTSGFLIAYKYYKNGKGLLMEESNFSIKKKVNEFGLAVVRRFLKFTPYYLIVMAVAIITVKISRQISLFEVQERVDENCKKSWWKNVAYVNNLFIEEEMCLSWSWYMAIDMQFFLLGLTLLILSTRFWKLTAISSIALVIVSSFLSGYYESQYVSSVPSQTTLFHLLYISPWTRIGPYLTGMFTAYFTVHLKGELVLKKAILVTCWLISAVCFIWSLSGLNTNMSYISAILHASLSRIAWSFFLSWVIIATFTQNAGVLKSILTLSCWTPINKLFYSVYMLSPLIFTSMVSNAEAPVDLDSFQTVAYFLGCLTITYICGFILSLLVEIPLTNLGKKFVGHIHIQNQLT